MKAEVLLVCWSGAFRCVLKQCQKERHQQWSYRSSIFAQQSKARKVISKQFGVHHSTVRNRISTSGKYSAAGLPSCEHPSKLTSRLDHCNKTQEQHLRLQTTVGVLIIEVHDSTVLNGYGLFGRVVNTKCLLPKINMAPLLGWQSYFWTNHKTSWTMGLMQEPSIRTDLFLSRAYELFKRICAFTSVSVF